jgi:uncharacterized protein (DUF2267 family)
MSVSSVDLMERMLGKINERLKELIEELAIEDLEDVQRILESDLQLLPDQLTVDEGALTAQVPIVLRGAANSAPVTLRGRTRVATSAARAASSRS